MKMILEVSYSLDEFELGSRDEVADHIVGEPNSGSGTGLGYRDLTYYDLSPEEAERVIPLLHKAGFDAEAYEDN